MAHENDPRSLGSKTASCSSSNHRVCAERRLLAHQMHLAMRHGVAPHKRIAWARRKFGGHIAVVRPRADGSLGCSIPCVLCRAALIKHDISVHVVVAPSADAACMDLQRPTWYHGRMTDPAAPASKPTSGQVKRLGFGGANGS